MPDLALARQAAEQIYGRAPRQIVALPPSLEWRGIYRLVCADGSEWILRLLRLPGAYAALSATGRMLEWLAEQGYPAPQLMRTRAGQLAGNIAGWSSLLLSYVGGEVLDFKASAFGQLGERLAQLHALPLGRAPALPASRCDPASLRAQTLAWLALGRAHPQPAVRALAAALHDSLAPLAALDLELQATHGDCWYRNAIASRQSGVVLIDWDCAGRGLALLDLGYLLLTAHYDLAQPLRVVADQQRIAAIVGGYQRARAIGSAERAQLLGAVRFPLALHLGEALQAGGSIDAALLAKLQARFEPTAEIARSAAACVR